MQFIVATVFSYLLLYFLMINCCIKCLVASIAYVWIRFFFKLQNGLKGGGGAPMSSYVQYVRFHYEFKTILIRSIFLIFNFQLRDSLKKKTFYVQRHHFIHYIK